jgi:hypothetical protein
MNIIQSAAIYIMYYIFSLLKKLGYSQIKKKFGILNGEISDENESIVELLPGDISCFKYALIVTKKNVFLCINLYTTTIYIYILRNNGISFQFNNLKSYFLTSCWDLFQN